MLAHYDQNVLALPSCLVAHCANENWCMSGYHAVPVLADAITKGLDIDRDRALEAMVTTSKADWYAGLGEYMRLGYVPYDKISTAASNTLEYSYDDWTIWHTARLAGNEKVAEEYLARAQYYRKCLSTRNSVSPCPKDADTAPSRRISTSCRRWARASSEGNSLNFSLPRPAGRFRRDGADGRRRRGSSPRWTNSSTTIFLNMPTQPTRTSRKTA